MCSPPLLFEHNRISDTEAIWLIACSRPCHCGTSMKQMTMGTEEEPEDKVRQAEAALIAAGLVKPASLQVGPRSISQDRRAELARLYAEGGPLSEAIIAERDGR
jgi:hypothetical protein